MSYRRVHKNPNLVVGGAKIAK